MIPAGWLESTLESRHRQTNNLKVNMNYEVFVKGVKVYTLEANRTIVKLYMLRTSTDYAYLVRSDGKHFHCHLRNGRLYITE